MVRLQQRDLKVTSWASQIRYLVPLIHRTADMSDFIISQFATMGSGSRIQGLVYHLADVAGTPTDPVFLTRPSYVLRTADDHVRLNDSWKIASRLRYMLQSLDTDQQTTLLRQCSSSDTSLPSNAEALVIAGFNNWRSWDLADVSESLIMDAVWCHSTPHGNAESRNGDLLLELAIEKVRIVLDPGPKENRIGVYDISTTVSMTSSAGRNMKDARGDVIRPRTVVVQAYVSRFGINLNWELVELIGDTMELFMSKREKIRQPSLDSAKEPHPLVPWQQLHVVVGMDSGVIKLDSINITIAMAASGIKASMLHQVETDKSETRNILLTSQSASVRIKDDEKVVLSWLLDNTILSLSKISNLSRKGDRAIIKAASKCEKLLLEMRDDLGHSLEIAHRIVRDEVDIVKGLAAQLGARSQSVQKTEHSDAEPQQDIHIALFLNQYSLSVAILPLLDYIISGNGARMSVVPRKSSAIAINFDLEDHSHAFKLKNKNTGTQVAMLHVPPINGRVVLTRSATSTKVNLDTTLNKFELDGRSVRSCVDTVNKPEVVQAFVNAKKSAQRISSQLNVMFPSQTDTSAETSEPSKALLYAANVTLIGLGVHVSAPALKSKDYRAELDFVLGLTTVRLRNGDVEKSVVHEQPQFEVSFRGISLYINRRSNDGITKYGSVDFGGQVMGWTKTDDKGNQIRVYHAASDSADVNLGAETASLAVDIAAHLQERIKSFTLSDEVKRLKPLRRLTTAGHTEPPTITVTADYGKEDDPLWDPIERFE